MSKPSNQPEPESKDLLVYIIRNESKCSKCGKELGRGCFLFLDRDHKALCLDCAEMDHLDFLPRGDAALSRRSRKYSRLSAVVLQWSRTRKQYERQGILAEREAIEKASAECAADSEIRRVRAAANALRRAEMDQQYLAEFTATIRKLYPGCPAAEAARIADHACEKCSGRVGRSALAKRLDAEAVFLAVQAHIRHTHTEYDDRLMQNWDRDAARAVVQDRVAEVLERWRNPSHA